MIIKHIIVRNFGAVKFYDTALSSKLNILDTNFADEISTIIKLLLCSKSLRYIQSDYVSEETFIAAEVMIDENMYFVEVKFVDDNSKTLSFTVKDVSGNNRTKFYINTMSHCMEQDTIDNFDGRNNSFPLRLCWYMGCDDCDAPNDLYDRTNYVMSTKMFRSYLTKYIKNFKPELINNKKKYKICINKHGKFKVLCPDVYGEINLSQTDEKLFWYICFLNVAEFWEDIEKIRNMHYEKKPLLINNFLEFLDQSTDINSLIERTIQLGRQIIILTLPMKKQMKKKWMGDKK